MSTPTITTKLTDILTDTPTTLHVINPPPSLLVEIIEQTYTYTANNTPPTLRIYAPEHTYTPLKTSTSLEAIAHELQTTHNIEYRIASLNAPPTLLYDNTILAIIEQYFLETEHAPLSSDLHDHLSNTWDNTTPYTLTTPTLSTITTTLSTTLDHQYTTDTQTLIPLTTRLKLTLPELLTIIAANNNLTTREIAELATTPLTTEGALAHARTTLPQTLLKTTTKPTTTPGRPPKQLSLTPFNEHIDAETLATELPEYIPSIDTNQTTDVASDHTDS